MIHNTYLVTGGCGFIGSLLTEDLAKRKVRVIAVDISVNPLSYFQTQKLKEKVKFIKCDVCDFEKINRIIEKYKIDCIFHLAAQAEVEKAYRDPKHTLANNILGTVNILEAARRNPFVKAVVVASSDKAYGKLVKLDQFVQSKYLESDPLAGNHPYEVSKSCTDLIARSFARTYGLPVTVARFGNVYGEGDLAFSRLIPGIMKALINDEVLQIRSNGRFVRDYIYVKDVVRGYLMLADNIDKVKGEAFNFGSNDTLSVLSLISLISQICQIPIKYKILNIAKNEIPYQSLDFSKIRKTLGWKPEYSVTSTVKSVFKWYGSFL